MKKSKQILETLLNRDNCDGVSVGLYFKITNDLSVYITACRSIVDTDCINFNLNYTEYYKEDDRHSSTMETIHYSFTEGVVLLGKFETLKAKASNKIIDSILSNLTKENISTEDKTFEDVRESLVSEHDEKF